MILLPSICNLTIYEKRTFEENTAVVLLMLLVFMWNLLSYDLTLLLHVMYSTDAQ